MTVEKYGAEAYSLHRYLDEYGAPDHKKIFSNGGSKLWIENHIDVWLLGHLHNQPDMVREDRFVVDHLKKCEECRNKVMLP